MEEVVRRVLARLSAPTVASPYLRVEEAAEYLRAPRSRVYDLVSSLRLTRHKDGSRVLINRAARERHLAGESAGPLAARANVHPLGRAGERVSGE